LACVLVPPAGSPLIHGLKGPTDRPEQIPYVKAGFAVVSFDISGATTATSDSKELRDAIRAFRNAQLGVNDAFEALAIARAKYPQIDRDRVYVAGHSSAATLALQIASSTNRVRACVAYAPVCDFEERFGAKWIETLDEMVPGMARTLRVAAPKNRVSEFHCPLFLFHALDDSNVSPATVIAFKNDLVRKGVAVDYIAATSGDHYDSMIRQGIPKAIQWLKRIDDAAKR
ncbi:MAG: hypothetical protein JWR69_1616, partial [Pedosphaera sp.]|nr:hypothetical protein [Pedosphaera sp.]